MGVKGLNDRLCLDNTKRCNSRGSVVFSSVSHTQALGINVLIITITISSNMIGVSIAALYFTNHSVHLQSDSVIGQLAVIGHL